jgi:hypothetical protein
MAIWEPLYSPNLGLCGFRCRVGECARVVRTRLGIRMHVERVHGVQEQAELFEGDNEPQTTGAGGASEHVRGAETILPEYTDHGTCLDKARGE